MQRDLLIQKLKERTQEYCEKVLEKDKSGKNYICPFCKSGSGKNGTSAFSFFSTANIYKCFKCSDGGKGYDIFDICGAINNTDDFNKQFGILCDSFGYDGTETSLKPMKSKKTIKADETEEITNFTDFFLMANKNINNTTYHRGISIETLNKYKIGFIEEWQSPKIPNAPKSPRLIIPITSYSYLARDTRTEIPLHQKQYQKTKVKGKNDVLWFFNYKILDEELKEPLFLTEGEIDALSILDCGFSALSVGSVSNIEKFIDYIKNKNINEPIIIAMDNDESGNNAKEKLHKAFEELNIKYTDFDLCGAKDVNDYFTKCCKDDFKKNCKEEIEKALLNQTNEMQKEEEEKAYKKEQYLKNNCACNYITSFFDRVIAENDCIQTKFGKFDKVLDGGLYNGLYVIGAESSVGKTTFVLNVADKIAESGTDVLIFSLEMSRDELIAKSISKETVLISKYEKNKSLKKTTREILSGKKYEYYADIEKNAIVNAMRKYEKYSRNLFIFEGQFNMTVEEIKEKVSKHIEITKKTPIVIVDYLQILPSIDNKLTDKQSIDKNILMLKQISRDYKLPLICISSYNRNSYAKSGEIMSAFNGSGCIEYSTDVLISLSFKGIKDSGKEVDLHREKTKEPREIILNIIKNRNGAIGGEVEFKFYPKYNYFEEC